MSETRTMGLTFWGTVICLAIGCTLVGQAKNASVKAPIAWASPVAVRQLGERIEELWKDEVAKFTKNKVGWIALTIGWRSGERQARTFEVRRDELLPDAVAFTIRVSDKETVSLIRNADKWSTEQGEFEAKGAFSNDSSKPVRAETISALLRDFVTDEKIVRMSLALWIGYQ